MSYELPTPPVPDLARAKGESVPEAVDWFIEFYNQSGAPFNYRRATRSVRAAYKGLHTLGPLVAGCAAERTDVGRTSNTDVVKFAAPYAFGRETQVFDLSPRRFSFGKERRAAYRIPFLFVENQKVYVYYLQPRKSAGLDFDSLCMVATIIKRYLIDTEFFGQTCDVEFVDLSAPTSSKIRIPRKYSLNDLPLWPEKRLADRLTLLAEALDKLTGSDRVVRRHRVKARPEPEMPLFD